MAKMVNYLFSLPYSFSIEIEENQIVEFPITDEIVNKSIAVNIPDSQLTGLFILKHLDNHYQIECEWINQGTNSIILKTVHVNWKDTYQSGNPNWRVFIDAGECAWCGVKQLSDLSYSLSSDLLASQLRKEPSRRDGSFHRSSLQTVIYEANSHLAFLWGFLCQRHGYNGIDILPQGDDATFIRRVSAWQVLDKQLQPGEKALVDPLVCLDGGEPLVLLEEFSHLVQLNQGRQFNKPPVVGMMTWYGYRTAIDQDIVLQNAALVANLFDDYPQSMQKIMLIDHGWQPDANWGYWGEADSQRFPNGIKWLSDRLRQCGLDLALWFTPFCVTENCPDIVRLQPLLACTEDGQLYTSYACVWGQLPGQSAGQWPIHFFNGSLEAVQAKWGQELMRMFEEWGCAYWKLDFFTLITSQKERFEVTVGDLYAQTYSNFRKAVGEIGHLAPCSCDTNMQLSYNDSIRIAADIGNAGAWPKELESFRRGLSTIASLWYKHRRFWVNDADSIQVGCGCGLNEARVRATVVAFSGSHLMVSEDLRWVSPDRLEIIRRLLPAYGQAARPIDLFDHPAPDVPHIWQLEVESDWGACNALAIFNLTEEIMKVQVQPDWFGLPTGALFGVIEWWQQRWIGKFDGIFEVIIPPMDVAVLHAQLLKPHPWLISVSHHFTGGLIIENLSFDPEKEQLKGEVVTRPGISMSLMGTVPPGWTIPSDADYHGRCNGDGGWAYEVRTTSQRTPFAIQFSFRR